MPASKSCMTCLLFDKECSGPTKDHPAQCKECRDLIARGGTRLICKWAAQEDLEKQPILQDRVRSEKVMKDDSSSSDETGRGASEGSSGTGCEVTDAAGIKFDMNTKGASPHAQWLTEEHVSLISDLAEKDEDEETIVLLFETHFPPNRVDGVIRRYIRGMVERRKQSLLGKAFI